MMGLWADGWFYISSAGLLVSGILFFFLLGQYRLASEAADVTEGEQGIEKENHAAISPVYIPEKSASAPAVASHPLPEAQAKPAAAPEVETERPQDTVTERRRDPANTTGGISPAVVYLQSMKGELAELHKDLRSLAKRVDDELASVATRDEALIERLAELTRVVENLKGEGSPAEPAAPAPKRARKAEKAPEPAPAAAPEFSPNETVRLEPGSVVLATPAEPEAAAPAPAAAQVEAAAAEPAAAPVEAAPAEPAPEQVEEKPRRGPVWPV